MATSPDDQVDLYQQCDCQHGKITLHGRCVLCNGVGFFKVGVTLGQLERFARREQALQGDPAVPKERRRAVLTGIKAKLEKAFRDLEKEP